MKIIFDSKDERKKFIYKVQGCPSQYGLEANCVLSCADCWSNALVGISEIKQDDPILDGEEQHKNDLIFAKEYIKKRIGCMTTEVYDLCGDDCRKCQYNTGMMEEILAYQIAIQCIEREERLRKWLTNSVKATTSA